MVRVLIQVDLESSAHDEWAFQVDVAKVGYFQLAVGFGLAVDNGIFEDKCGPSVGVGYFGVL